MDKLKNALLWVKTHSLLIAGMLAALLTIAVIGRRSARSDLASIKQEPKTSGAVVEEQAKEADSVNAEIRDLNSLNATPPRSKVDKPMEDLISEYEKL